MRASWSHPFTGEFEDLVLQTLAREGEEAALARLLAALDAVPLPVRRDHLYLLAITPGAAALDWLEARIESPVVETWGSVAAVLGIRWERIQKWMARGRPHSLAALDALVAYAHPHRASSPLHRDVKPLLSDPPSLEELRGMLSALVAADDAPRVTKTVAEILGRAGEILRGGPWLGISARAYFERAVERAAAQRVLWAESRSSLPAPGQQLVASGPLRTVWLRRWNAAVQACERRGGSGQVKIEGTLQVAERLEIERELGIAIPGSLVELFMGVAARVEMSWDLPDDSKAPPPFTGLSRGACAWDVRRLPELERRRRGWVDEVFSDPDDEYARVWMGKLAILDLANGDLIAVDLARADSTPVVYLSHDYGAGHGRVLGHSVLDFVDRWTRLGCVGPEEWQLTPFLRSDAPYLDADGECGQQWRRWFGLDVLAAV